MIEVLFRVLSEKVFFRILNGRVFFNVSLMSFILFYIIFSKTILYLAISLMCIDVNVFNTNAFNVYQ